VNDPKSPSSEPRNLAAAYQALAELYNDGGMPKDALPLLLKGRDLLEKGTVPQNASTRAVLARTYHSLGLAQMGLGQLGEALQSLQKAADLREQSGKTGPPAAGAEWVDTLLQQGAVLDQLGRPDDALKVLQTAVTRQNKLVKDNPK